MTVRYPGVQCDIPSINYQYTWAPSPKWKSYYATGPEIFRYFKNVAVEHDLLRFARLRHKLVHAQWDEQRKVWKVKLERNGDPNDIVEDEGEVLVNATGVLNKWRWPDLPHRERFQGKLLHSASYEEGYSLEGKRVMVIGSGSSGVQIIPAILDKVSSLVTFVRSPTWITAGFAQRFAGKDGCNFDYNEEQREVFKSNPRLYLDYRKYIESELNTRFRFILNGSQEQKEARKFAESEMRRKLQSKPELQDAIIPTNFAVGCRRPTPGNGYLEALCSEKVQVVRSDIAEFTERGVRDKDGNEHTADVIICATGFDVSWRPRYPLIGREGHDLAQDWAKGPDNYLSVTVPYFPNYFTFMGPFAPYGHGSVLPMTEHFARHFSQMVGKMLDERVQSFEPTAEAVADFREHRQKFLPRTAWMSPCRSWFKQSTVDGEVMMWPGSRIHFFETMQKVRWEDYKIEYCSKNRFEYFGNGFATRETDGRDLSYYLGLRDGKDVQPDYRDEDIDIFLSA